MNGVETKRCRRCLLMKPRVDFYMQRSKTDDRQCWCIACAKETNRLYLARRREVRRRQKAART